VSRRKGSAVPACIEIDSENAASRLIDYLLMDQDIMLLVEALQRSFPTPPSEGEQGGWAAPSLNVLDCVLSLNRNYDKFCLPRVERFKEQHPTVDTLANLLDLIRTYSDPLEFSVKELNYRDENRAATLVGVLNYLIEVQKNFTGSSETDRLIVWASSAKPYDYESLGIRGFGLSGFQYLRILFGGQTVKPDVHIRRFVSKALGHTVQDVRALTLMEAAGKHLGWPLSALDYAIWDRLARRCSDASSAT
jgi:hypothetical protein